MSESERMAQAIHELGTAIAWIAHASIPALGTELAGKVIEKCDHADYLMGGAQDE